MNEPIVFTYSAINVFTPTTLITNNGTQVSILVHFIQLLTRPAVVMLLLDLLFILSTSVFVELILRPFFLAELFCLDTLVCIWWKFDDNNAMSSAKSKSSNFIMHFHLIPVLFLFVTFFIIQSITIRKIKPDIASPRFTPVLYLKPFWLLTFIQYCTLTILIQDLCHFDYLRWCFHNLPLSSTGFLGVRSQLLSQSPQKVMYKVDCHSTTCSTILRRTNICSTALLPILNPACSSLNFLQSTPCPILSISTLPNNLLGTDVNVMPRQFPHSDRSPFFGYFTISPCFHVFGTIFLFPNCVKLVSKPVYSCHFFHQFFPFCIFLIAALIFCIWNTVST